MESLTPVSQKISEKDGREVASDLLTIGREHCPKDKARPIGGKDDAADRSDSPRGCEKFGLILEQLSFQMDRREIIRDIQLAFHPGILYGILGPNGSGKSTLLKLISGIWRPSRGSVLWNEQNLHEMPRKTISSIVSLVPQSPQIPFDFTVEDIVRMGQYSKKQNVRVIADALEQTELLHLRNRPVTQLSTGERQRVYLARSLAADTPIVLLDEPAANLDIHHQLKIWKLIGNLVSQNKIVIVTVHDLIAAKRFFDEVIVLSKGMCASRGTFEQAVSPKVLEEIFEIEAESLHFHLL